MACGEYGMGRMAEPAEIVAAIEAALAPKPQPSRAESLITAGQRAKPLTGALHFQLFFRQAGLRHCSSRRCSWAKTVLVSGPVDLPIPPGVQMIPVTSAVEMLAAANGSFPVISPSSPQLVADRRVAKEKDQKIKKDKNGIPDLQFVENPDILQTIAKRPSKRLTLGWLCRGD
jgi:phosphopantothenoylcysteine decarboxylase/phosphopantothenate--cysteine ligase